MFLDFLQDLTNYKDRVVANTLADKNRGITVDTAFTSDEGYETALLVGDEVHPVERYPTKEEALLGHKRWVKKCKTLKKITKLGWTGMGLDEEIILPTKSPTPNGKEKI